MHRAISSNILNDDLNTLSEFINRFNVLKLKRSIFSRLFIR